MAEQWKRDCNSLATESTSDLFSELDPVGVGERTRLLVNVVNVQDLAHELDDRLSFIKSCGWHWNTGQGHSEKLITQVEVQEGLFRDVKQADWSLGPKRLMHEIWNQNYNGQSDDQCVHILNKHYKSTSSNKI